MKLDERRIREEKRKQMKSVPPHPNAMLISIVTDAVDCFIAGTTAMDRGAAPNSSADLVTAFTDAASNLFFTAQKK